MKQTWIALILSLGFFAFEARAIEPQVRTGAEPQVRTGAEPQVRTGAEPQEPSSLCERFLGGAQDSCAKKMKEMKPDWYLAAVCNLQSDDQLFYQCLSKGARLSFSPRELEPCSSVELSDQERMNCVDKARTSLASSFQNEQISRKPASLLPAKKKH